MSRGVPSGTIRLRREKGITFRMIKVTGGTGRGRWMTYARWWWLTHKGPIPPRLQVIHKNGDSLDDRPENLELGTTADVFRYWEARHPELASQCRHKAQIRSRKAATQSAIARRILGQLLKMRWYLVDHTARTIRGPYRRRKTALARLGLDASVPTVLTPSLVLGWPDQPAPIAILLAVLAERQQPLDMPDLLAECEKLAARLDCRFPCLRKFYYATGAARRAGLVKTIRRSRQTAIYQITEQALSCRQTTCSEFPFQGRFCQQFLEEGYVYTPLVHDNYLGRK